MPPQPSPDAPTHTQIIELLWLRLLDAGPRETAPIANALLKAMADAPYEEGIDSREARVLSLLHGMSTEEEAS